MSRKLRRQSAFDRWIGNRLYLYYLIGWWFMVVYGILIWNVEIQSFLDIIPLAIGMFIFPLVPFLILVFLDYLAFCIHQRKLLKKATLFDNHSYASGWEIQNALDLVKIPNEEYSLDKTEEET